MTAGPRAAVVRVAVLDANVIRYTSMSVLRELRIRGWRLRVGDIALLEVMSHLEDARERIMRRHVCLRVNLIDRRRPIHSLTRSP